MVKFNIRQQSCCVSYKKGRHAQVCETVTAFLNQKDFEIQGVIVPFALTFR